MRPLSRLVLLGLASVLLASGCGSAARPARTAEGPSSPPVSAAVGRQVFAASCSVCHGLTGAESSRKQGGDLAAFRMTEAQIESETRVMPVVRRPLTDAQLRAVSQYVLRVQQRHAAHGAPHGGSG